MRLPVQTISIKSEVQNDYYRFLLDLIIAEAITYAYEANRISISKDGAPQYTLVVPEGLTFTIIPEYNVLVVLDKDARAVPWESIDIGVTAHVDEFCIPKRFVTITSEPVVATTPLDGFDLADAPAVMGVIAELDFINNGINYNITVTNNSNELIDFMFYGGMIHVGTNYDRNTCELAIVATLIEEQGE